MHSNFITPPDFVTTVLIVDATEDELLAVSEACRQSGTSYNVYLYNAGMKEVDWLVQAVKRSDIVLQKFGSTVPILEKIWFGEDQDLKKPADYFAK